MPSPRTGYAIVAAMLLLAGGAFLRAEQLKLQLSPVARPLIAQHISPTCTGSKACRRVAKMSFKLRKPQSVALAMVDASGNVARSLPAVVKAGRVYAWWNGRLANGSVAPDGGYRLQIHLGSGKTITPPDRVVVDTVPPVIVLTSAPGAVPVRYTAKGQPRVFLLLAPPSGPASFVRAHGGVARVPAGKQVGGTVMTLVGTDAAGNRSKPVSAGTIG